MEGRNVDGHGTCAQVDGLCRDLQRTSLLWHEAPPAYFSQWDMYMHVGCVRIVGGPYGKLYDEHGTSFWNITFN